MPTVEARDFDFLVNILTREPFTADWFSPIKSTWLPDICWGNCCVGPCKIPWDTVSLFVPDKLVDKRDLILRSRR